MGSTNIQIAIKTRPLIEREQKDKLEPLWMVKDNNIVHIDSTQNFIGEPYSFDHIFDDQKSNKDVYDAVVKPLVMSCLEGINSTIFAYGQTSSGKTHTMLGDKNIPGIISFTVEDIFTYIDENTTKDFLLRCSYLEIYNEKINDLLDTNSTDLKIREDYSQGVYVSVKEEVIREPSELFNLMKKGMKTRKIGCTDMNERSSRSHTIFRLVIQSQNKESEGSYTESTLSLVDLAGSERVGQMNMGRERQVEGVSINKSLTTLGLVIRKLSENDSYINYRDSKLTRLLQQSLGGNSNTLIIATITVAASEETKSTLEFAQRAKYVKNRPIINERVTDKDQLKQYQHMCKDYMEQIEKLRREKMERENTIIALEGKISNIQLFSSGSSPYLSKPSKIPHRRHTLGYYKPHKKITTPFDIDESSDNDNEDLAKELSPVKYEERLSIESTKDDKENESLDESVNKFTFKRPLLPVTPKTPSTVLRARNELLEESYENLKYFTNIEKQLHGDINEIESLRELTNRLREENIDLHEKNVKCGENLISLLEENKEVYEQLLLLKTILGQKPVDEVRRNSLHTIMEEEVDLCGNDLESSMSSMEADSLEENDKLKSQIVSLESIVNSLKNEFVACKDTMTAEKKELQKQVDKLQTTLLEERDTKEAELEILNNIIKKLNNYKEEMHKKISELEEAQRNFMEDTEVLELKRQNRKLGEELDNLKKKYEEMKQLNEYDTLKIDELEEEIQSLLKSSNDLQREVLGLNKLNENLIGENKGLKADKEHLNIQIQVLQNENYQTMSELENTLGLLNKEQKDLENVRIEFDSKTKMLEETLSGFKTEQDQNAKKIEELVQANLSLQEVIGMNEDDIIRLKNELTDKATSMKTLENALNSLRNDHKDASNNIREMMTVNANLKEEIARKEEALKKELEEKTAMIQILETTQGKQNDEINSLEEIKEINSNLKKDIYEKEEEILKLRNELNVKTTTMKSLENDLNNLEIKQKELKNNVEKMMADNGNLKEEIIRKEEEIHNSKKDLVEKISDDNDLEDALNSANTGQEDGAKEFIDINSNLKEQLQQVTKELSEKALNMQALENELSELKRCREEKTSKAELINASRDEQIRDLTKELNCRVEELAELKQEIVKKEEYSNQLEKSIEEMKFCVESNEKQIEKLKKQLRDELLKLETADMSNQMNSINIENLQLIIDDQKTEISLLQEQLQSKINELNEKCDTNNDLLVNFNTNIIQNECLTKELEKLRKELDQMSELSETQKANDILNTDLLNQLNQKTDSYNEILLQYNMKVVENQYLTKQNIELKKHLDSMFSETQDEVKPLNVDVSALKEENKRLKSELQDTVFELNGERKELETVYQKLEEKSRNLEALDQIVTGLKVSLREKEGYLQELTNKNLKLRQQILSLEEEVEELKGGVQVENSDLVMKEMEVLKETYQSTQEELLSSKQELQRALQDLKEKTDLYNTQVSKALETNDKITLIEQESKQLKDQLAKYPSLSEIDDLKLLLKNRLKYIQQLEDEKGNLIKCVEQTKEDKAKKIDDLQHLLDSTKMELEETDKAYKMLLLDQKTNSNVLENLKKANDDLENLKLELTDEIKQLKDASHAYTTEIELLKGELQFKDLELEKTDKMIEEISSKYDLLKTELGLQLERRQSFIEKEMIMKEQLHELDNLRKEKSDFENLRLNYLDEINSLSQTCNLYKSEQEEQANELDCLRKAKSDFENLQSEYLNQINSLSQTCNLYKTKQEELTFKVNTLLETEVKIKSLEQTVQCYEKDIQNLKIELTSKISELSEATRSYNELHHKTMEECAALTIENTNLKQQLNKLAQTVTYSPRNSFGSNFDRSNLCSVSDDIKTKMQEIQAFEDDIRTKTEKIVKLEQDKRQLIDRLRQMEHSLKDTDRQLKERCQDFSQLKSKLNVLELQLIKSKKEQQSSKQEMINELKTLNNIRNMLQTNLHGMRNLSIDNQVANLITQIENLTLKFETVQEEARKAQLKATDFNELNKEYKKLLEDHKNLQTEHKMCLIKINEFGSIRTHLEDRLKESENKVVSERQNMTENRLDFTKTYEKLVEEYKQLQTEHKMCSIKFDEFKCIKSDLQQKLKETENKMVTLEQQQKTVESHDQINKQLNIELTEYKTRCKNVEAQWKRKVESLSKKLQNSEREVSNLQCRLSELSFQSQKRAQENSKSEKNSLSRLSDEGAPMSPNEVRKMKRQSLHDQRRGLSSDCGDLDETEKLECKHCTDLKIQLENAKKEVDRLDDENKFLDKENQDMLGIMKYMEQKEKELYEQLESKDGHNQSNVEPNQLRITISHLQNKNAELNGELLKNKNLIKKRNQEIAELQKKIIRDNNQGLQSEARSSVRKDDKGTQATCDIYQKYNDLKNIALLRRREGNHLRSLLNLPADCAVLPGDLQRQPKANRSADPQT